MRFPTSRRTAVLAMLGLTAIIGVFALNSNDFNDPSPQVPSSDEEPIPILAGSDLSALEQEVAPQIAAACTTCHGLPIAEHAPREDWHEEIELAKGFFLKSPLAKTLNPDWRKIEQYFLSKARPASEIVIPARSDNGPGSLKFKPQFVQIDDADIEPSISNIKFLKTEDGATLLYATEMRTGRLQAIGANGQEELVPGNQTLLSNPAHVEPCDLDGDGVRDLIVADLGYFRPTDNLSGRVVWLRTTVDESTKEFACKTQDLAFNVGRVADVQPADFDGDGDQDLVVAEFGWREIGSVFILWNEGIRDGTLQVRKTKVDDRNGAIHVPVADLNNDGRPDFIVLVAQQHEKIDAYLNVGDGKFEKRPIYEAPHGSYGSSGIELVDVDGDADLDILYANGDGFDRSYLKPYHSVQWLENRGDLQFVHHHLTYMPGCHRALGRDFDRDGDIDVVCVAYLSPATLADYGPKHFDGVIWLEQTSPGTFARHPLLAEPCHFAAAEAGDFDSDGDVDFVAAAFSAESTILEPRSPALTIWWNETVSSDRKFSAPAAAKP